MHIAPKKQMKIKSSLQLHADLVRAYPAGFIIWFFNIRWLSTYHNVYRPLEVNDITTPKVQNLHFMIYNQPYLQINIL